MQTPNKPELCPNVGVVKVILSGMRRRGLPANVDPQDLEQEGSFRLIKVQDGRESVLKTGDQFTLYGELDELQAAALAAGNTLTQLRYAVRDGGPSLFPQFSTVPRVAPSDEWRDKLKEIAAIGYGDMYSESDVTDTSGNYSADVGQW